MKYNTTQKEYRIGLGLYFKLVFNHNKAPGKWMSISNIPGMDYKVLKSDNEEDAMYEVSASIQRIKL